MNLKELNDFCAERNINPELVEFWCGHKEVVAMFGSIPGIPDVDDEGWSDWYDENYGNLDAMGIYYHSDMQCYVKRIA